jgi:hypothetical protein
MEYQDLIKEEELIERKVAYCLHFLDIELLSATKYYPKTEAEKRMINEVYSEVSEIIEGIIIPESMRGPLPDEYT